MALGQKRSLAYCIIGVTCMPRSTVHLLASAGDAGRWHECQKLGKEEKKETNNASTDQPSQLPVFELRFKGWVWTSERWVCETGFKDLCDLFSLSFSYHLFTTRPVRGQPSASASCDVCRELASSSVPTEYCPIIRPRCFGKDKRRKTMIPSSIALVRHYHLLNAVGSPRHSNEHWPALYEPYLDPDSFFSSSDVLLIFRQFVTGWYPHYVFSTEYILAPPLSRSQCTRKSLHQKGQTFLGRETRERKR